MNLSKWKSKLLPFMDQGVVSGGNFIAGVLLARALGMDGFGQFSIFWLVVLFFSSLNQAGISTPLYTLFPQKSLEQKTGYLTSVGWMQALYSIGASGLLILVFTLATPWVSVWNLDQALLGSGVLFSFLTFDFIRRLHYCQGKTKQVLVLDSVVYTLQLGAFAILTWMGSVSLTSVLLVLMVTYLIPLLGLNQVLPIRSISLHDFKSDLARHWTFSKWLIGTALLQWTSGNFFLIAASVLLGPAAVGAIRILQNLVGVMHVVFQALEHIVPLRASQIFQQLGSGALKSFLKKIAGQGVMATTVMGISMAVCGPFLVRLLYGDDYVDYAHLLYGFALLYIFVFTGTILRFAIRTLELNRSIFIAYTLSTIFSICLAHPVIQFFGIAGVVIGLIASQVIIQIYFLYSLTLKFKQA
ncbi:lipopolysaccharide biosynthesis protein [bacterium SCSIO 12741]|nr:lipopolysaccharide biosynthesis protein [bacterium SCSIO 12741]